MSTINGSAVIFYNRKKNAVLVFRRDDKPQIPFPNMLDILGGHLDEGETPEHAIVREMAEELIDHRTGKPFLMQNYAVFKEYTDSRGAELHIYACEIDLEIDDLTLLEGQSLEWVTEAELDQGLKLAYEFETVLKEYFESLK